MYWLSRRVLLVVSTCLLLASLSHASAQGKVSLETVQLKSGLIGRTLPYHVVLPPDYSHSTTRYPVLYLLHGLFAHYSDWPTRTNLADYAANYRVLIVTPEGGDNWYTDSATVLTDKYESYIVQELLPDVDARFRTIRDRRGRGIAGLSMGGYGALKFGIKYPDLFVFAGSMSGALDAASRSEGQPGFDWDILRPSIMKTYGADNAPTRAANDLHRLFSKVSSNEIPSLPFFYFDCGTDDGFLKTNRELAQIVLEKGIPHQYCQLPGGHDWGYWDERVQEVLRLFSRITQRK